MSPLGLGNLRDPVLTNCEMAGVEVINSVAALPLINYTTTVTTRFSEHMSVFLVGGFFFRTSQQNKIWRRQCVRTAASMHGSICQPHGCA